MKVWEHMMRSLNYVVNQLEQWFSFQGPQNKQIQNNHLVFKIIF